MRHISAVALLVCVGALGTAIVAHADGPPNQQATTTDTDATADAAPALGPSPRQAQRRIDRYRRVTWRWQRVMGTSLTRRLAHAPVDPHRRILAWKREASRASYRAHHPPHVHAWECIHRYEGSWTDPNPPYYGGLQMDLGFQETYGRWLFVRKGTADHWTPLEQMWVAEKALRAGRGFYPWPLTARWCGLLG